MFRFIAATAVLATTTLAFADVASAQSVSREHTRSTTTTSQDGNTTRTVTRSTTVSGEVSVDAEALGEALAGALTDRLDPEMRDLRRRSEPARPEDIFGDWLADDGARDSANCRIHFRDRAFLGVRGMGTEDCPRRLATLTNWRVDGGQVVLYRGPSEEFGRLMLVDGRLIGAGLVLRRPGDLGAQAADPAPEGATTR